MEEDDPDAPDVFPQWALLEYKHMLALVGPGSTVHFTSLSRASIASLQSQLASSTSSAPDVAAFELHSESVVTVAASRGVDLAQICLLDPKAPRALTFQDFNRTKETAATDQVDGPFLWFLFGGILGDDPPRDRTASLRTLGFPGRHLGGMQMTTDTALGVTKRVVEDNFRLDLPDTRADEEAATRTESASDSSRTTQPFTWVDQPELKFGPGESVEMPFRYMAEGDGSAGSASSQRPQPLLPPGMRELIRKDLDRSFEF